MSQGSVVIDYSGTGAEVSDALEALFQRILSKASGSSRPADIQQNEDWFDTDTPGGGVGTLNRWDGTNDVVIGQFDTINHRWIGSRNTGPAPVVASASTVDLTASLSAAFDISGTTNIDTMTLLEGQEVWVRFQGVLNLVHGASLVLLSAANIATAAGDWAKFRGYAGGVVRMASYQRANGKALVVEVVSDAPFAANKNGVSQNLSQATWTKLTFGTEEFDVGGYYDTVNSKWVPPAGKRTISANVTINRGAANFSTTLIAIYKNGGLLKYNQQFHYGDRNINDTHNITAIVDANGTDFFEVYAYQDSGGNTLTVDGTASWTYWCGR